MAVVEKGKVRMLTRSGLDWTAKFRPIAQTLARLPADSALVDGEVVVLDEQGVSSFRLLQEALSAGAADRLGFQAFDLPYLDGRDLMRAPLLERKQALRGLLAPPGADTPVPYPHHGDGSGPTFFPPACRLDMERLVP